MQQLKAKKRWVRLIAPKLFNEQTLGETLVSDPEEVLGRKLQVNLTVLTNDPKTQNVKVGFIAKEAKQGAAETELVSYYMMPSAIKRMVRRGGRRIDDSFACLTADKISVRVKPLAISRHMVKGSISAALGKQLKKGNTEEAGKLSYIDFASELIQNKFQTRIKQAISKIYPLRTLVIRFMGIEQNASSQEKQAQKAPQEEPQTTTAQENVEETASQETPEMAQKKSQDTPERLQKEPEK